MSAVQSTTFGYAQKPSEAQKVNPDNSVYRQVNLAAFQEALPEKDVVEISSKPPVEESGGILKPTLLTALGAYVVGFGFAHRGTFLMKLTDKGSELFKEVAAKGSDEFKELAKLAKDALEAGTVNDQSKAIRELRNKAAELHKKAEEGNENDLVKQLSELYEPNGDDALIENGGVFKRFMNRITFGWAKEAKIGEAAGEEVSKSGIRLASSSEEDNKLLDEAHRTLEKASKELRDLKSAEKPDKESIAKAQKKYDETAELIDQAMIYDDMGKTIDKYEKAAGDTKGSVIKSLAKEEHEKLAGNIKSYVTDKSRRPMTYKISNKTPAGGGGAT